MKGSNRALESGGQTDTKAIVTAELMVRATDLDDRTRVYGETRGAFKLID